MLKIHVNDLADLERQFIRLVGVAMTHIKNQDMYANDFGYNAKQKKKESLERMRAIIKEIRMEKVDESDIIATVIIDSKL